MTKTIDLSAIYQEVPITKEIPAILDKFVVDFANGIDVVNDHVRVQKTRTGLFSRMLDSITGNGPKRQHAINEQLSTGLESALKWLTELNNDVAQSYRAITLVNERVTHLQNCVVELADYSADTRKLFENFAAKTEKRLSLLESRLDAHEHKNSVINQWKAGRFNGLSAYAQCHLALQLLNWGDWGNWWRMQDDMTKRKKYEDLKNECVIALAESMKLKTHQRANINQWLLSSSNNPELIQANQYLGDIGDTKQNPYIYTASQDFKELPLCITLSANAPRLVNPLVNEVLDYV